MQVVICIIFGAFCCILQAQPSAATQPPLWAAKLDVPSEGVKCEVSSEELGQNLDPKGKPGK